MLMMVRSRKMLALLCLAGMPAAHALSSMDDTELSAATGQSGLTVTANLLVSPNTTANGRGAAIGLTDTDGAPAYAGFTNPGDVYVGNFGLSGTFTATIDAGAAAGVPSLRVALTIPSSLTLSFNTPWPSSGTPAGLGVGVMDVCATPGSGYCTPNAAGDYAVMMAPSTGVNFTFASSGLLLTLGLGNSPSGHFATLSDTAAASLTISGTQTTPNLALVDPGNVATVGTTVGGIGVKSVTVSGLEFGSSASPTTFDLCKAAVTAICTLAKTGGNGGLLVTLGSSAMTNVSVVASGVTIGNVGTASANNGVGLVALTNLGLANTSVLVSGH